MEYVGKLSGTEPIDIVWLKDRGEIRQSKDYEISYHSGTASLYIREVIPAYGGNYTLQAKNEFGEAVSTASLQVNRKYRFYNIMGQPQWSIHLI